MDIAAWLHSLGLERYEPAFRENEIDWSALPKLTDGDLRDLGVVLGGHRRRLLDAIAALDASGSLPGDRTAAFPAATPIKAPRVVAGEAERRQVTVMFADLVGSTALSARLDPEDMREILGAYHRSVAAAVARFEGHIAKFMGDGVLIYFGWPQAHEDEAERSVRAGLALVEAVEKPEIGVAGPLSARVGIATGLVVVGDLIGEGAAQEEAVVGETPNLAARLEQLAVPGAVVVAEATRRLLGSLFEFADLGPQSIRGIDTPVPAFRVLGEARTESRFEALRNVDPGPPIGREHELAILMDRWNTARGGEGQVVLLPGEAGIGKSRIVHALRESLRNEPRFQIEYSCSPYYANSALWPVVVQIQRAAGYLRDDAPALKLAKLEQLFGQAAVGSREDAIPLLAELMGLPLEGRYAAPGGTPQEKKARVFVALSAQVEGLARQRPTLLVLEDAHWLDPTSAELFDRMIDRIRHLPVLFVATLRPETSSPWTNLPHATVLGLNRLGRQASQALVERTAGKRSLPATSSKPSSPAPKGYRCSSRNSPRRSSNRGFCRQGPGTARSNTPRGYRRWRFRQHCRTR
jgi:class 3 adenylate cyclase